jgi:hypothetical protein
MERLWSPSISVIRVYPHGKVLAGISRMKHTKTTAKKQTQKKAKVGAGEENLTRVRRICMALPETTEKTSHGEPTFFVHKRVFCMFANNHHNDGHVAVWVPTKPGLQATLLKTSPDKYFYPPYVGGSGWIGIELAQIDDEDLGLHILEAWGMIEAKQKKKPKRGMSSRKV